MTREGRGRDEDCSPPPAQIPACAANAPGSSLGSNVGRHAVKPRALRRTAANRIDVATRLSVRTTAACRLFPSGEALPSTISAGSLPSFVRSLPRYYDLIRLLTHVHARRAAFAFPSRPGTSPGASETSQVPRKKLLHVHKVYDCARFSHPSQSRWEMLPSRQRNAIGTSELDPFRSSILGPWSPLGTLHVGPRGTPRITRGWDGWLDLSHGGLSPPILCQLPWRTRLGVIRRQCAG